MSTGVLITGYGGPDSLDAVGPFMKNLMGVEPSPELLERVRRRYLAIGGASPLTEIAHEITKELKDALDEMGSPMPVEVGMAYWNPFIDEALASLKDQGCDRVIVVSLSPFESRIAHGKYRESIDQALEQVGGIEIVEAPLVSTLEAFPDFFAGAISVGLTELEPNEGAILVFTAHSLPESDLVDNDPYVSGLEVTANRIALKLGLAEGQHGAKSAVLPGFSAFGSVEKPRAWFLVYQSKGNRPGAWLGPEIDALIEAAAPTQVSALIVCPIGFMTDHMETMYDLDIVAADKAFQADLEFMRIPVPNQDQFVIKAIASMVAGLV